jgi:mycothiol synthase
VHYNYLTSTQQEKVFDLIAAANNFDGIPPIAEHILLHLRHGGDKADSHLLLQKDYQVIAYAHLDKTDQVAGPSVELVIHPVHRSSGVGSDLLKSAIDLCGNKIRLWSHGDLPQARQLAQSNNFTKMRTVIQMSKDLNEISPIDCDYQIRSFLPDLDNQAWLSLNNQAFAHHPEQGNWSEADLSVRLNEDWFDEKGFFVAQDKHQLIGFCWTKIHGGHSHSHETDSDHHDHEPIGEIYVTAVSKEYEGRSIGKALTITGLNYLKYKGLTSAMLYVDEENKKAVNLYKSLSFVESGKDVLYKLKS